MPTTSDAPAHVRTPGWLTRNVLNRAIAWLSRRGIAVAGSRVLVVEGRSTGQWRRTPVNPLGHAGADHLVAARGHVQWTHNMRAAGGGLLEHGRRARSFTAVEVPEEERPEILRAYLRRWGWEVGAFFDGLGPDSSTEELRAAAARHPVFRLTYTD